MPELAESQRTTTIHVANELRPILVRLGSQLGKETTHLGLAERLRPSARAAIDAALQPLASSSPTRRTEPTSRMLA